MFILCIDQKKLLKSIQQHNTNGYNLYELGE